MTTMSKFITAMRHKPFEKAIGGEIDSLLQRGYETQRKQTKFTTKKSFAPSALGWESGRCPRRWQYMFNGVVIEDNNDYLSIATMSNGTLAHGRIQKALEASGAQLEVEKKIVCNDPPIFGYIDAIVKLKDYGDVPLEIKTTRVESFEHRRTTGTPADYHLVQLLIYMKLLNSQYGAIVYENRNDQSILTIPVEMNEKNEQKADEMFDWMRTVYDTWRLKTPVARPVTRKNAKLCKECPVKDICWSEPGEGLGLPLLP